MLIATWNVNSVRTRLEHILRFLDIWKPDIVCLQELKCQTDDFPDMDIRAAGYQSLVLGQKSYNGVAILCRKTPEIVSYGLPGEETDEQARFIEAVFHGKNQKFHVASLYLPNGNPVNSDKYEYKLRWMERLRQHACALFKNETAFILAGDYNVIPTEADAANPEQWIQDALYLQPTREKYRQILNSGLQDILRLVRPEPEIYTFWDYQAGAWQRNNGIRIDHFLTSPRMTDTLQNAFVFKDTRDWEKPSDHVPVLASFDI